MIRLQTYAAFSLLATTSAVYYAFSSREQFYPAMVYLSASKVCFVLLLNTGLVAMCAAWQLVKRIFLGPLREAEAERLNEQSWREAVEILFAVTIFRQDFSVTFLAMVAALLLIKALHWLAQKRVEYIETTPSVPMLSHVRIVSFMAFLLAVDCLFLWNSLGSLIQKREASVAIFFSFEYMILATSTISTFIKYVFYVSDMLMEGQWEKKVSAPNMSVMILVTFKQRSKMEFGAVLIGRTIAVIRQLWLSDITGCKARSVAMAGYEYL